MVVGTATATVKHPSLEGWKLLVVQLLRPRWPHARRRAGAGGRRVGAGAAKRVMLTSDGKGTRALLKSETTPGPLERDGNSGLT